MSKYEMSFKLKTIKFYESGYTIEHLINQFNISRSKINFWITKYRISGEEGLKWLGTKNKYSKEFKLFVLKYMYRNKLTYIDTAKHFGIGLPSTITNWRTDYENKRNNSIENVISKPKNKRLNNMTKNNEKINKENKSKDELIKELKERNEYLEAEILYTKKLQALIQKKEQVTKKKHK